MSDVAVRHPIPGLLRGLDVTGKLLLVLLLALAYLTSSPKGTKW